MKMIVPAVGAAVAVLHLLLVLLVYKHQIRTWQNNNGSNSLIPPVHCLWFMKCDIAFQKLLAAKGFGKAIKTGTEKPYCIRQKEGESQLDAIYIKMCYESICLFLFCLYLLL